MRDLTCHACMTTAGYRVINSRFPDIYKCTHCNHIFRRYNGDVSEFHRDQYRSLVLPSGNLGYDFKPIEVRTRHVNSILAKIDPFLKDSHKCLEVGFGDGVFTRLVSPHVKKIECCEIDPNLALQAEAEGFDAYCENVLNLKDLQYDSVFAFDIMEHVLDIQQFKDKMTELTKKTLVIQVPVNRMLKPPNRPQGFDGHCHYFSADSIKRVFEKDFELKLLYTSRPGEFANGCEMLTVWEK